MQRTELPETAGLCTQRWSSCGQHLFPCLAPLLRAPCPASTLGTGAPHKCTVENTGGHHHSIHRVGTPSRRRRPEVTQGLFSEEAVDSRGSLLFLLPALEQHLRFCPGDRYGARESKALPKGQILRAEHRCGLKRASKRMKMWVLNDKEGTEVVGHPEFLHLGTKSGRWRIPG